jgi:peptidoglycan hydrolase-like protein with peptidoglycan-binding domain
VDHWFRKLYGITLDQIRRDVKALMVKPEPTPTPDDKVLAWMKANTLRLGSKGKLVGFLQAYLDEHGYNPVAIDDDFGPKTEEAVKGFQKANGLPRDGVVGPLTWRAIMK